MTGLPATLFTFGLMMALPSAAAAMVAAAPAPIAVGAAQEHAGAPGATVTEVGFYRRSFRRSGVVARRRAFRRGFIAGRRSALRGRRPAIIRRDRRGLDDRELRYFYRHYPPISTGRVFILR